MKKKMIAALIALSLGMGFFATNSPVSMTRAEEDLTPDVTENFEDYQVGDMDALSAKWTNAYFKHLGDGDELATKDNFDVQKDPLDENNKCLYVHTYQKNESFFYNTMKDVYVKDFRLTYKYYQTATHGVSPWAGFNFRQPEDGRYNGVTNVMMVLRAWADNNFGPQMYRAVGDSLMNIDMYGPLGEGTPAIGLSDPEGLIGKWLNVKIEVIGSHFAFYVNDQLLGQADITKVTANQYGYVSIISCVCDSYFDDIYLENLDEEPYNPGGSGEEDAKAPTMETKVYEVNEGEDLVITCDTHGEAITSFRRGAEEVLPQYYEVNGNEITISKDYLATLGHDKQYFIIQTAGGSVSFTITVLGGGSEPVDPGTSEDSETPEEKPAKKGCGGSVIAVSAIASIATLAGAILLISKKRKQK